VRFASTDPTLAHDSEADPELAHLCSACPRQMIGIELFGHCFDPSPWNTFDHREAAWLLTSLPANRTNPAGLAESGLTGLAQPRGSSGILISDKILREPLSHK
jgi:hypothetical protein